MNAVKIKKLFKQHLIKDTVLEHASGILGNALGLEMWDNSDDRTANKKDTPPDILKQRLAKEEYELIWFLLMGTK